MVTIEFRICYATTSYFQLYVFAWRSSLLIF